MFSANGTMNEKPLQVLGGGRNGKLAGTTSCRRCNYIDVIMPAETAKDKPNHKKNTFVGYGKRIGHTSLSLHLALRRGFELAPSEQFPLVFHEVH